MLEMGSLVGELDLWWWWGGGLQNKSESAFIVAQEMQRSREWSVCLGRTGLQAPFLPAAWLSRQGHAAL